MPQHIPARLLLTCWPCEMFIFSMFTNSCNFLSLEFFTDSLQRSYLWLRSESEVLQKSCRAEVFKSLWGWGGRLLLLLLLLLQNDFWLYRGLCGENTLGPFVVWWRNWVQSLTEREHYVHFAIYGHSKSQKGGLPSSLANDLSVTSCSPMSQSHPPITAQIKFKSPNWQRWKHSCWGWSLIRWTILHVLTHDTVKLFKQD